MIKCKTILGVITVNANGIRVKIVGSSKANLITRRRKVIVHFRAVILIKGNNPLQLSFNSLRNN
jgi:hypothetical protein